MNARPLKVGFIGAGPATQAIHLPVLARMAGDVIISDVMDVDERVASIVAARCGARVHFNPLDVLCKDDVDIVVICSPNAFHAEQVIAACRSGKKAVLCEKPLAVSREEADLIGKTVDETGTQIFVGTMHAYDPAYQAARIVWDQLNEETIFVQSAIYLPPNAEFENQATQPAIASELNMLDIKQAKADIRQTILGLAIHDVPLVRHFYPEVGNVFAADAIEPTGYAIAFRHMNQIAEFNAMIRGEWPPSWTLNITGKQHSLHIDFPPSYVLSGSAKVKLTSPSTTQLFEAAHSGYEMMWTHIVGVVLGREAPLYSLDTHLKDLNFALTLADGVDALMGRAFQNETI